MNRHHANIVNMLINRKTYESSINNTQKRLFEVYAETKSVKSYTQEEVQFMFPEIVKSTLTMEFQKDSSIMATTHGDHTVKIIDFSTGIVVRTLIGHPRTPWSVRFHPRNPDILVSGCIGSVVIVWNWRKNEVLAYTQINTNVIIASLDWHPTEEVVLITCGTAIYLWDYSRNSLVNLFPTSLRNFQYAFFCGDGSYFIASYENSPNHHRNRTYTICRHKIINDKYNNNPYIYGSQEITRQSCTNSAAGICFSKSFDYALLSIIEENQNVATAALPLVPTASSVQLQNNAAYVNGVYLATRAAQSTIFPRISIGASADPSFHPAPPEGEQPIVPSIQSQNQLQNQSQTQPQNQDQTQTQTFQLTTPPSVHPQLDPVPPPLQPLHLSSQGQLPELIPLPLPQLGAERHPILAGTQSEQILLQPMQHIVIQHSAVVPSNSLQRFIAKISLAGDTTGKVMSRMKIPDNAIVSSLKLSPSNDFLLSSFRSKGADHLNNYKSVLCRVYRQSDWRLYFESLATNDNANIAIWSSMMDGLAVGTERGRVFIYRSEVSPLARTKSVNPASEE